MDKSDHDMAQNDQIIQFHQMLSPVVDSIDKIKQAKSSVSDEMHDERQNCNQLADKIDCLARDMGISVQTLKLSDPPLKDIDGVVNRELYKVSGTAKIFPSLRPEEYTVAILSGFIAVLIDVIFVGTPEVVKIYRGGERFDGSLLTGVFKKLGKTKDGELSPIFKWFSDTCKVPYDISAQSGVMNPNNHRLRNFSHDPFLGVFFAVVDILCGTTTCIDNSGQLKVLLSPKEVPISEKFLALFYYLGHLLSDLCTARGLPVPGFCLTQFFTNGASDASLAKIAERMYLDGYDLRHLASTAVPVGIKNLLVDSYLSLTKEVENTVSLNLAEKERRNLNASLKREKMMFVSNVTATVGNTVKFLAPPNCGNPCALNLSQWFAFVTSSCAMIKAGLRDRTVEAVMDNREAIEKNWDILKP